MIRRKPWQGCKAEWWDLLVDEVPVAEVVPLHDQPRGRDVDLVEHEGHQHHDHQQAATSHQAVSDT